MSRTKTAVKTAIDAGMVLLLPFLTAEMTTGRKIHEWLGAAMLALFIAHNILNSGAWRSLFKGRYTPVRAFAAALDILLAADAVALGISGAMMSGYVFAFLPAHGGTAAARRVHLCAAYWGIILISLHMGAHIKAFAGAAGKLLGISGGSRAGTAVTRAAALAGSVYGVYAFASRRMWDFLFLRTQFVFYDASKPAAAYFAENAAVICLFATAGYIINGLLRRAAAKRTGRT